MPKKTFNDAIANASFSPIDRAIGKIIKSQLNKNRLIGPRNKYRVDAIGKIRTESQTSPTTFNSDHLEQYIGSSIIQHCFDGWNYLSRGVESYINGENGVGVHLLYYSELRAVMSIMASHGIGIFDKQHIYTDGTNTHYFNGTTHNIAKDLYNEWSSSVDHISKLTESIKIKNRKFSDWITATGIGATAVAGAVVKDFLDAWSIDLRLNDDQTLRNEMSYRPQFETSSTISSKAIENIIEIWKHLEPSESDRFEDLDLHLFRNSLENLFEKATGKNKQHVDFRIFITNMFNNLGEPTTQFLFDFLLRESAPLDHVLLQKASLDNSDYRLNLSDPLPMISRSILLLRLASGLAETKFVEKLGDKTLLDFWWSQRAIEHSIISSPTDLTDKIELYADVRDAISDMVPMTGSSNKTFLETNAISILPMKQFQRVCFWGIGL